MAPSKKGARSARSLIVLAILIAAIFGSIAVGNLRGAKDASWIPRFALDLEGGTQIVLTPKTKDNSSISESDLNEAVNIIRQRVNSTGVTESEITRQGGSNVVVSIPGKQSKNLSSLVTQSAVMNFRPVIGYTDGSPTPKETPTATPSEMAAPTGEASDPATDPTTEPPATDPTTEPTATPTPALPTDAPLPDQFKELEATSQDWQSFPGVADEVTNLDCKDVKNRTIQSGIADRPLVTCSQDGTIKYLLGPVVIEGLEIVNAQAGYGQSSGGVQTNKWVVNLEFNAKGKGEFSDITTKLSALQAPANQFAIVLDSLVVSAPSVSNPILDGRAEISGSFDEASAKTLANQLNFGSLPLSFEIQSETALSATLGSEQLEKGLLAGLIGLILVVLYSLFQYRGLGLVTVASLIVATGTTYGVLVLLGPMMNYRLSLAGVAGVIVSIGITADSFIVYFERIRDEIRDGRALTAAVDQGWIRARRTILASDAVNLIAAITLYFLAVGGVQGFAFTLGLTTIIDLIVVFLFTHPLMTLLVKTKFFSGGNKMSGLDPTHLGRNVAVYRGRGEVKVPGGKASDEGLTIAERRAKRATAIEPDKDGTAVAATKGTTKTEES